MHFPEHSPTIKRRWLSQSPMYLSLAYISCKQTLWAYSSLPLLIQIKVSYADCYACLLFHLSIYFRYISILVQSYFILFIATWCCIPLFGCTNN